MTTICCVCGSILEVDYFSLPTRSYGMCAPCDALPPERRQEIALARFRARQAAGLAEGESPPGTAINLDAVRAARAAGLSGDAAWEAGIRHHEEQLKKQRGESSSGQSGTDPF